MKALLILLSVLSISLPATLRSQDSLEVHKYSHQLQLIDSVKAFIANDLGLYVPRDFYSYWSDPKADSMFTFLYVSYGDHVGRDTSLRIMRSFSSETLAVAAKKDLIERGYDVLVYKTAGMSNALITTKLLSYPDEAITFIVLHEVVHRNLQNSGSPVSYTYEESLCDAVANITAETFARKYHLLDTGKLRTQTYIFEEAYTFMNEQRKRLDTMAQKDKAILFRTCTDTLQKITADANQFQKDRMRYEVNNAYFLRMQDYATYYFTVRNLFMAKFDLREAVDRIRQLPVNWSSQRY